MKLHLLFVFFLAAPLLGRFLSGDSSPSPDVSDASSSPSSEVHSAVPASSAATSASACPTETKITPAPSRAAHPFSPSPSAPRKADGRSASLAQAFIFI